ncbi:MAG: PLP-dependent aminotransferase family protein [Actinomycetota bacterium]|nr:PLP-dependent aminotransferase family protein [Actinomycetota bacterium]
MPKYQFDKWTDLYANRTGRLKSSAIRDLLSVTQRSDIISLAGGTPYTRDFKLEKIVSATTACMLNQGNDALQYGGSEGHVGLKKHIVKMMSADGINVDTEDFIVTGGSQQALDLIGKIFIDPGDVILVEAPSYLGALDAFTCYEPKVVSIPLDEDGVRVDELEARLRELAAAGIKPKFMYLVPNFHNPAGVTLSAERRRRLIELSREFGLLLVEDNPYGRLRFEGEDIPSLRALDEHVIYLSTFSKIFSPGIRLGWIMAPHPILEKIIFAKQSADLCSSSFTQRVVEEFLNENELDPYLNQLVKTYRSRRDAMLAALDEFFPPEATWSRPRGGFFVWARLPEFIDTTEMLAEAIGQKVAYVPGRAFFADGSGANFMRLAFCYPSEEDIHEGIKRLAGVVKDQISLYHSVAGLLRAPAQTEEKAGN